MKKRFDYDAHVKASRIFYATYIPRIDGHTGIRGLPLIFEWVPYQHLLATN